MDADTRVICDLDETPLPDGTPGYAVNRINVPPTLRGKGHASRLMRERVLPAADDECAILHLWIQPSGGLDYTQLAAWYYRLNFRPKTYDYADGAEVTLWVRHPVEGNP